MKSRFSFFDAPKDIFQHADKIKIELHQIRGKLAVEFEISGGYWPEVDDEDDNDSAVPCCQERPNPTELAVDLLARFVAAKTEGGA